MRWFRREAARKRGPLGPRVPYRPPVATRNLEAITAHVEAHLGPIAFVSHEQHSSLVHLDVLVVAPTPARDCWVLVTSGMSDAPMRGRCCDHPRSIYAELMTGLPPDWRMDGGGRWAWPFERLRDMARYPHEADTSIMPGDTFRYRHAPGGRFRGSLFVNPSLLDEEAWTIPSAGHTIHLLGVCWLLPEELDLAVSRGTDALVDRACDDDLSEVLRPDRPSFLAG